jgi:hypothetical protein
MLAANEEAIASLYRVYASRFIGYTTFWNHMAKEEIAHAAIIRRCSDEVEQGLVHLNEKRFNKEALKTYSNYIKRELDLAQEARLSLVHAFSTTFYIEQSLIEARFFEVFEGGSEELKKLLNHHRMNSKEHLDKIRRIMTEQKSS